MYQTTLCEKLQWDNVNSDVDLDPDGYLNAYNNNDIQLICCQADASMLWLVPDVVQKRFIQSLEWDLDLDILFIWVLSRERPKGKEVVKYEKPVDPPSIFQHDQMSRKFLMVRQTALGYTIFILGTCVLLALVMSDL